MYSLSESAQHQKIELLIDKEKFFKYKSDTSLHSFVTRPAYGYVVERECVDLSDSKEVCGQITLNNADRRFYLKVIACLSEWRKYVCPLTVAVNGKVVYDNGETFFEQVCLGWPALYIKMPDGVLKKGVNKITVKSNGGLYLSELSLVSYPQFEDCSQISVRKYVREGDRFAVAIKDENRKFTHLIENENCIFLGSNYYRDILVLSFTAGNKGDMSCSVGLGDLNIKLKMPKAVENNDYFVFGTDSDDHRQDDSDETAFILETFVLSDMGDFVQFRPKFGRNYYKLLSKDGF
ncbi:MAG: hypothetical protein J6Q32_05800, partial [Clostridia bacterium]|nr:hypothetical protein [Clostridia bacterium]